jgi:NCAIR mutase (PurE)-related protein
MTTPDAADAEAAWGPGASAVPGPAGAGDAVDPQARLAALLAAVRGGEVSVEAALERLKTLPFEDLGYAKVDHHRQLRNGFPEVIFCEGKTAAQVLGIVAALRRDGAAVLGTRAAPELAAAVAEAQPGTAYYETARCFVVGGAAHPAAPVGRLTVVTAGTTDIPVAEEAAVTGAALGLEVERVFDVGVAGIQRLFARLDAIRAADVVIVAAGMDGALASVVGGLVDRPVIAVPTSVGYGASFHGVAALLTMLNSCASGVTVVNIDNGFGAAYAAATMVRGLRR